MKIFVSDVHLSEPQSKRYGAFLHLLDRVLTNPNITELYLVGDIFDLWVGDRNVFIKMYRDVVDRIQKISQLKDVYYFEGNHDFLLGAYWKDKNIHIVPDERAFYFDDKKVLISHGDLLNKKDYGYRILRWFFRTKLLRFLVRVFPENLIVKIGKFLSTTDQKKSPSLYSESDFLEKWNIWVHDLKQEKDFDVLICGHYHIKVQKTYNTIETVNLGSWLKEPFEVLIYQKNTFAFHPYTYI